MAAFNPGPGNDTLDGIVGNVDDILNGGLGDDLYRYRLGSGNDVITDAGGSDSIRLDDANHLFNGMNSYRSGNDLIIDFNSQGRLTITNQFVGAPIVEFLAFADADGGPDGGPVRFSNTLSSTASNDFLVGGILAEGIDGNAGDDWIFGNQGNDTILGGDGNDEIQGGRG